MESNHTSSTAMEIAKLDGAKRGDVKGYLHVGPSQFVRVSTTSGLFPVNLRVYPDGTMQLPAKVNLKRVKIDCDGKLFGVKELVVSESTLNFGNVSGSTMNDTFYERKYFFEHVTVNAEGKLRFLNENNGNVLEAKRLEVKTKGIVQGRKLTVMGDVIDVNEAAMITADGQGFKQGTNSGELNNRNKLNT